MDNWDRSRAVEVSFGADFLMGRTVKTEKIPWERLSAMNKEGVKEALWEALMKARSEVEGIVGSAR